ncbi:MAG: hypothetical protein HOP19_04090, partial [Acidobacteria bacterium]|nr:hypothetical protein [Acidobacteriota bacterium]
SGILLAGVPKPAKDAAVAPVPAAAPTEEDLREARRQRDLGVALRRVPRSAVLDYAFHVYNAALDPATKQPQLTSFVELYKDGKRAYQGPERPVNLTNDVTPQRVACYGQLSFDNLAVGDYTMRVVVMDKAANRKYAQVEQWIDFTVN